jgi:hypothetical protein
LSVTSLLVIRIIAMLDHFPNLVDAGPFKFFPVTLSNHYFLRKYPTANATYQL